MSHSWCQIGVEILWHKPVFQRVNTLYRLLNVIDPLPVADETIGGHRARMLIEGQQLRSLTSSPSGASSLGESASSSLVQPSPMNLAPANPPGRPSSGSGHSSSTRQSSHRALPWDYPQFLVDDPDVLATAVDAPHRTFKYAHFVRRLNLGNIADAMSDHSFFRLRTCARLERLTLQGCLKLSDSVLAAVLGDGNMQELVALDLTNVKLVTDRTVVALARGCPRLQGLNLSGCRLVTDEGVTAIAEGCKLLRRVGRSSPVVFLAVFLASDLRDLSSPLTTDQARQVRPDYRRLDRRARAVVPAAARSGPRRRAPDHLGRFTRTVAPLVPPPRTPPLILRPPHRRGLPFPLPDGHLLPPNRLARPRSLFPSKLIPPPTHDIVKNLLRGFDTIPYSYALERAVARTVVCGDVTASAAQLDAAVRTPKDPRPHVVRADHRSRRGRHHHQCAEDPESGARKVHGADGRQSGEHLSAREVAASTAHGARRKVSSQTPLPVSRCNVWS